MNILAFIERNKFSVLGTLIVHIAIFVWSNWNIIETGIAPPLQDRVLAVMDFSKEAEIIEDPNQIDQEMPQNQQNAQMQNVSANVSQEKTTYTNSFSKAKAEQEVLDELKNMEKEEFQSLANKNSTAPTQPKSNPKNTDNQNANLVKEGAQKNDKAGYGMDIVANVYFQLKDRTVLSDKKPSYLCKSEGIVRVIIKVNQKGQVVTKSIDETKTNTTNECLRNAALEYAGLWKFNQNFNDEIRKQGWIEFRYVAQ